MKLKNKFLTGLTTLLFSLLPYQLHSVPADPNNLPNGWKQYTLIEDSRRKIRVKIGDRVYLETLITTEKIIYYQGEKRKPFVWATTDLRNKIIKDITTCRKADFTATISYLDKSCDLKQITKNLSKCYKNASKLTFGYDVLEKTLLKIIEIEGKFLKSQLTGSTVSLTELIKQEIEETAKNFLNKIKNRLIQKIEEKGLKAIKEIKKELESIIEKSVYSHLNWAGKKQEEALKILEKDRKIWSYEDASKFYSKFKKSWVYASSILAFWCTLKDYSAKEIAIKITNALSKGTTGKSLEDLIGICIEKDKKLERAFNAFKQQREAKLRFFRNNIERMFDYTEGGDPYLFLHPEEYK